MTQAELNRAVAHATGEAVDTISRHGFSVIDPASLEREPLVIDWDDQEPPRYALVRRRLRRGKTSK